jgi:hypothetical protein
MKKNLHYLFLALLIGFVACEKGDNLVNEAPDNQFSLEAINLSGENRLNSIVTLSWSGKDPDGYIKGFELSRDGMQWSFTTIQDSTFKFSLTPGSDTTDIELFVRAIDNEDLADPTPDRLNIPIRNTPPTALFSESLTIPDTAYLVATTEWKATDIDGDETITEVLLSINGLEWYPLNRTKNIISIVPIDPTVSGTVDALIYYGTESNPQSKRISGLNMNDTNRLFINSVDQAGAESIVDTSSTFFMKGKSNTFLVIGGVPDANDAYRDILQNGVNLNYDFIDLAVNSGANQPKIWNITFRLQLRQFSKLFLYSDESLFDNSYTNQKSFILEFAAASLLDFANQGGKYFISTSFNHNTNIDAFTGVLPIESVSTKNFGSARLWGAARGDSALVTAVLDPNFPDSLHVRDSLKYPDLTTQCLAITGLGAFIIDSTDTEIIYEAQLSDGANTNEWTDTKIVASGRRLNGKLNQVFFNVQLFELRGDPVKLNTLFNHILNVEFN